MVFFCFTTHVTKTQSRYFTTSRRGYFSADTDACWMISNFQTDDVIKTLLLLSGFTSAICNVHLIFLLRIGESSFLSLEHLQEQRLFFKKQDSSRRKERYYGSWAVLFSCDSPLSKFQWRRNTWTTSPTCSRQVPPLQSHRPSSSSSSSPFHRRPFLTQDT